MRRLSCRSVPRIWRPPEFRHPFSQLDVRSASGHVRGDGHLSGLSGLGHDLRLAFMILCIQHVVFDPRPGQIFTQKLRFFDGDRPHENGSLRLMQLLISSMTALNFSFSVL